MWGFFVTRFFHLAYCFNILCKISIFNFFIIKRILKLFLSFKHFSSSQSVSSVTQSCLTLCDPMNCSSPGFRVHHQLPELAQTHVHQVSDTVRPSHCLSSTSPPAFNLSEHQDLFQWVSSSPQVAKVLELFQVLVQSKITKQNNALQYMFRN